MASAAKGYTDGLPEAPSSARVRGMASVALLPRHDSEGRREWNEGPRRGPRPEGLA